MEELENEAFDIFFVDFGVSRSVLLRDICNTMPRFNHLPAQAVEMFLNGVERTSDSETARTLLSRLVFGKSLVAHIVQTSPHVLVDLYDTTGKKQMDIVEEMIRLKAVRRGQLVKSNTFVREQLYAG